MEDTRTHNQKVLEGVKALIEAGVQDGGQHTTSIDGSSFTYWGLDGLLKLHARYTSLVAAEEGKKTGKTYYRVRYRMNA